MGFLAAFVELWGLVMVGWMGKSQFGYWKVWSIVPMASLYMSFYSVRIRKKNCQNVEISAGYAHEVGIIYFFVTRSDTPVVGVDVVL